MLLLGGAASAPEPGGPAQSAPGAASGPAHQCEALAGFVLPQGGKILSAAFVPAVSPEPPQAGTDTHSKQGLPAYCEVRGIINPRSGHDGKAYGIGFALALPQNWNGRFLLQGGGGLNGSVPLPLGAAAAGDMPALARGFAVMSHDSGHKGSVFQSDFMADQRAYLDFANSAVPVAAEVGKAITARYFGKLPSHSYMAGCSTGGREAMLASQRYPELFDGIVVGAPAMRTGNSNLALAYAAAQFNRAAPVNRNGERLVDQIFSAKDRSLILSGLLRQCDQLDGLADGLIMNVKACRFDPAKLQCAKGKAEGCLSGAQVTAMKAAFSGPKDRAGYALYASFPYDTGIVANANNSLPGFLPTGRPGPFGPASRETAIDLDARIHAIRSNAGQQLTDTSLWTNLNTFTARGGKILFYHGVSDPWFSANDTLDYWQRVEEENGEAWRNSSRFYMVPGMGHCGSGNAFEQFDLLGAVVDWVEHAKAPEAVLSSRTLPAPATRPMCPWPKYAHFTGGDPNDAKSFTCRAPAG